MPPRFAACRWPSRPLSFHRSTQQFGSMANTSAANLIWFLNSLVTVHVSCGDAQDGISVLEHFVPHGFSPPLHVHRTEDEVFHVLEGEVRVRVRDQEHRLRVGDSLLTPKGVPHTYRVESS